MRHFVAVYDDFTDARRAVEELIRAGIPHDNIGMVANDVRGEHAASLNAAEDVDSSEGAGFGAVAGALTGLALAVIPGIGPALAAGALGAAAVGAVAGAATGGLVAGLVHSGVEQRQAEIYTEIVRRGGTLVSVEAPEGRGEEVQLILNRNGPIDPEQRAAFYKHHGWTGWLPNTEPYTSDELLQEQVRLGTMR